MRDIRVTVQDESHIAIEVEVEGDPVPRLLLLTTDEAGKLLVALRDALGAFGAPPRSP